MNEKNKKGENMNTKAMNDKSLVAVRERERERERELHFSEINICNNVIYKIKKIVI